MPVLESFFDTVPPTPPRKIRTNQTPPGKFPPRKFAPGIFPPMLLNIPIPSFNFLFNSVFQKLLKSDLLRYIKKISSQPHKMGTYSKKVFALNFECFYL